MGKIIYRSEQYAIQEVQSGSKKGYILFNLSKEFREGHSHLNNFSSAKYIIFLAKKQKLPHDLDLYRLKSLYRILEDGNFREKVKELLEQKSKKEVKKYVNVAIKASTNPSIC